MMSSIKQLHPSAFAEAADIDWFANCGSPDPFPADVVCLKDRMSAIESLSAIAYENFQSDRQGDLTEFLTSQPGNRLIGWNDHARYISRQLGDAFERLDTAVTRLGFPQVVADSAKCDLQNYYQEQTYRSLRIPIYFHSTFEIYQAGRLPCGYSGTYPNGRLCIY